MSFRTLIKAEPIHGPYDFRGHFYRIGRQGIPSGEFEQVGKALEIQTRWTNTIMLVAERDDDGLWEWRVLPRGEEFHGVTKMDLINFDG